jgi:hypothetical protein
MTNASGEDAYPISATTLRNNQAAETLDLCFGSGVPAGGFLVSLSAGTCFIISHSCHAGVAAAYPAIEVWFGQHRDDTLVLLCLSRSSLTVAVVDAGDCGRHRDASARTLNEIDRLVLSADRLDALTQLSANQTWRPGSDLRCSGGHGRTELERRAMMHTEIAFANERAIIADMLINLLTNVRLTYLPDLEPADAHELLLTGAYVLIAQLGSQPATAAEISRVIGRPRDVVTKRLDELIERGYVEHRGNRYKITTKLNVPNLQRHM